MHKIRTWWPGISKEPIGTGWDRELQETVGDLLAVMAAADARPAAPLTATDRLQRNLESTVLKCHDRAKVLREEIATREAELADVLRAEEAAGVALVALTDAAEEDNPPEEPVMLWPGARPVFPHATLTDEELEAALGRAIELDKADGK